jgi:hypothetical protein
MSYRIVSSKPMIAIFFIGKYNEAQLLISGMQIDNDPFPTNALELPNKHINQAKSTKGKNEIIGEERFKLLKKGKQKLLEKTLDATSKTSTPSGDKDISTIAVP